MSVTKKIMLGTLAMSMAGLLLSGCGKATESASQNPSQSVAMTATYMVTVTNMTTGQYTTSDSTNLGIMGLNMSRFAFITHKTAGSVWAAGSSAPVGVVHVAEWGKVDQAGVANGDESLDQLATRLKNNGEAYSSALTSGGIGMSQVTTFSIQVSSDYPLISFAGMIAPSADLFTGGYNIALFENGSFVTSKTVNLYAYSAESRSNADLIVVRGSSNNPAVQSPTSPVVLVQNSSRVLDAIKSQLPSTKVLGTVTITKM